MGSRRRKKLSDTVRRQIAADQTWHCALCRQVLSAHFEIDHVKALANGGRDERRNYQALCANCHAKKSYYDLAPHVYEECTGLSKYFAPGPLALDLHVQLVHIERRSGSRSARTGSAQRE